MMDFFRVTLNVRDWSFQNIKSYVPGEKLNAINSPLKLTHSLCCIVHVAKFLWENFHRKLGKENLCYLLSYAAIVST